MKTLLATFILLSVSALGQVGSHCYTTNDIFPEDICEFSDGSAHVWTMIGTHSWSEWYTAREWRREKVKRAKARAAAEARAAEANAKEAEAKAKLREAKKCQDYVGQPAYAIPMECN